MGDGSGQGAESVYDCKKAWSSMNLSILSDINHSKPEAGIVKNYRATNSGSPEVELRFGPFAYIVRILNWMA
jgi:hypothetical protein